MSVDATPDAVNAAGGDGDRPSRILGGATAVPALEPRNPLKEEAIVRFRSETIETAGEI